MDEHDAPTRTPINPLREGILRWISGSGRGQAFGHLLSRVIALPGQVAFPLPALVQPVPAETAAPLSEIT